MIPNSDIVKGNFTYFEVSGPNMVKCFVYTINCSQRNTENSNGSILQPVFSIKMKRNEKEPFYWLTNETEKKKKRSIDDIN